MSYFSRLVQNAFSRFGFTLSRTEPGVPGHLAALLRECAATIASPRVLLCDSDPEVLRAFYEAFPQEAIATAETLRQPTLSVSAPRPQGLLVVGSPETFESGGKAGPHLDEKSLATTAVVRISLGQCIRGEEDVLDVTQKMSAKGFRWHDVLESAPVVPHQASTHNLFLVFHRGLEPSRSLGRPRALRDVCLGEMVAHLSQPIVPRQALVHLAGPGYCGFAAGIYNPGAFETEGGIFLLARGERAPWAIQKHSQKCFESSCSPVLLSIDKELRVTDSREACVARNGPGTEMSVRREDFRVFQHQGSVFSNHSVIHGDDAALQIPIQPGAFRTSVGIAELDPASASLRPLGIPRLDRSVNRMEKNWGMFSEGGHVHCIYSFNPFRLFTARDFPNLGFAHAMEHRLTLPLIEDGLPLRNSINPVPYNADCFLHVVHKVYPRKRYVFWPVLIDRRTLRPTQISARPLLRAGASADASILYVSSAVCRETDVILFGGLNDSSIGAWSIAKRELDRHWVPIA